MGWQENPIMEWLDPRPDSPTFGDWVKISDHGREPLAIAIERIENKQRMADGTLRRYVVAKKRTFSTAWSNFPSVATDFLANGQPGEWMEQFHNEVNGEFKMRLRAGSDRGTATASLTEEYMVMITDFSKDIEKRGLQFDMWSMDITLEEV